MIDHLGINCADLEASKRFYDTVLGVLGYRRLMDFDTAVGYGKDTPDFWLSAYDDMPPNREVHIAFQAADPAAVEAFFETAQSLGAETLHAPRLWPEYHERYFGAFVRDLDGNNIEAVCHHAEL
ncbi:VOC family protein [Nocardioides humilatus]|uniref:VOC family protein n=1 Tax=Nocardioides humilatus TaxID=2607660 RepID=A0A5B1LL85_9ACTN|nr:VOC family protein [Nocardioides humilatus]KAA1421196.1 VOC family protein [Nocardioides humilatus]